MTGVGSGIGRATARAFAAEEPRSFAPTSTSGSPPTAPPGGAGGEARAVHLDAADDALVEAGVAALVEEFGRIDVLTNNAGISTRTQPLHERSLEE